MYLGQIYLNKLCIFQINCDNKYLGKMSLNKLNILKINFEIITLVFNIFK